MPRSRTLLMAQVARRPDGSIDLVACVRRIFDEDEVDKSTHNHTDSIGFDSEPAQSSGPAMAAPDPIGDAIASDQSSPTPQVAGSTIMQDTLSGEERELVSKEPTAAMHSAFNVLARTDLVENARTLEDFVGQMLPAILKTWLDHNLPKMVERLLRAEIERASRSR